ncbi:FkbM family methyltransferase [Methylococcus capsulatus]|uniref:FkbM family methyltransferase n=1 Tax=Methylococcus capsulatus TaxID=414 RepID=UPI001C52AB1E|nr:FkbM family methyltransferase [Methylococcus capsulatus]QXP94871.1 FkbM family methyltransferase [Methylococcus capsulatus]
MAFALHLLRTGDLFVDVGANLGSYTVLAAGAVGADCMAFEPIAETAANLRRNVALNRLENKVEVYEIGVGPTNTALRFTENLDAMNRVVSGRDTGRLLEIKSLDAILGERAPTLIKIDVEGFEMAVLEGAVETLNRLELLALIIELNPQVKDYGYAVDAIPTFLAAKGFEQVGYDPDTRELIPATSNSPNGIFVRNKTEVVNQLRTARRFKTVAREI